MDYGLNELNGHFVNIYERLTEMLHRLRELYLCIVSVGKVSHSMGRQKVVHKYFLDSVRPEHNINDME